MKQNGSNAREVKANEKRAARRRRESEDNWKAVLATEPGRYVVLELLDWCSTFRTLPTQPELLQRSAGVQTVGHHILERVADVAPEWLGKMIGAPYLERMREKMAREQEQRKQEPSGDSPEDDQ